MSSNVSTWRRPAPARSRRHPHPARHQGAAHLYALPVKSSDVVLSPNNRNNCLNTIDQVFNLHKHFAHRNRIPKRTGQNQKPQNFFGLLRMVDDWEAFELSDLRLKTVNFGDGGLNDGSFAPAVLIISVLGKFCQ